MLSKQKAAIAVLLVLLLSVEIAQYTNYTALSKRLDIKDQELALIEKNYEILARELSLSELQIGQLNSALKNYEKNSEAMKEELGLIKEQVKGLNKNLEDTLAELENKTAYLRRAEITIVDINQSLQQSQKTIAEFNKTERRGLYILAVMGGKGVTIPLHAEMKKGEGKLLMDTKGVFLGVDMQFAMQTAFKIAKNVTEVELIEKEIIFQVVNPIDEPLIITGESAGSAMTIALIALVKNQSIRQDVLITGTVEEDGSIGQVSYIGLKAQAAKNLNATILLVPQGQKTHIGGINIIEVSNIREAMNYMLE